MAPPSQPPSRPSMEPARVYECFFICSPLDKKYPRFDSRGYMPSALSISLFARAAITLML